MGAFGGMDSDPQGSHGLHLGAGQPLMCTAAWSVDGQAGADKFMRHEEGRGHVLWGGVEEGRAIVRLPEPVSRHRGLVLHLLKEASPS